MKAGVESESDSVQLDLLDNALIVQALGRWTRDKNRVSIEDRGPFLTQTWNGEEEEAPLRLELNLFHVKGLDIIEHLNLFQEEEGGPKALIRSR